MARASGLLDMTSRLLALGHIFLVWVGFWIKNHGLYPAHELLQVKNYDQCPFVALVRSGFFDRPGQVGHDRVTHASSSRLSKTNLKG
jgi:hypothetical protein